MHDRLIQSIALAVLLGGVLFAFMLTPSINQQRRDRQLSFDVEVGDNANPGYTLAASLGSFRGLFVNVLWQRAEELKQEGKFFEANNLAEMITTLQPRYPEAWNFHGWNMAYNISVKCTTAEERWDWVQKGMNLIRDRGIPNNPNAVVLYRSLAWILGHKMAGQTDDMHWYYKQQWVQQWHTLLGPPDDRWRFKPEYAGDNRPAPEDVDLLVHAQWLATERINTISQYADKYFLRPDGDRKASDQGVTAQVDLGLDIDIDSAYGDRTKDYNASNYFSSLSPEKRAAFLAEHPDIAQVVKELEALKGPAGEELGLGLNVKTLRAFGRVMMYQDAGYWIDNPAVISPETVGIEGVAIKGWLDSTAPRAMIVLTPFVDMERVRATVKAERPDAAVVNLLPMLDLLRAQALIADYHMDPAYMLYCMRRFGPLDWRHPSAHAVYWTALGTLRAEQWTQDKDRLDLINANRATIHGLQDLAHHGKIAFRPKVEALGAYGQPRIHYAADTRMIPAYERAVVETKALIESGIFGEHHDTSTYNRGHENFLHSAVVLYHFEGNEASARKYFEIAKEKYGDDEMSPTAMDGEYNLQLADFARVRMEDELGFQDVALVRYWIDTAWRRGVASRDPGAMRRYLAAGKKAYDEFLEERQTTARGDSDVQGRQDLPPFGDLVLVQFLQMMADPGYSITQKSAVWRMGAGMLAGIEAEQPLAMVGYMQMVPLLQRQAEVEGWAGSLLGQFPEPRGYRDWVQRSQQQQQQQQQDNRPTPVRPGS